MSTVLSPDLLFVGGLYCDLVFRDVPVPREGAEVFAAGFAISPGGVANRAVAAARAGARTALVSQLGDDVLGRHVHELLASEPNLDLRGVQVAPGWQSAVTVACTGPHDRTFITYEEPAVDAAVPASAEGATAVHLAVSADIPDWVAPLRAAGTTIVGGVGWDASGAWSPDLFRALGSVDAFIPNEAEATAYTRTGDALAAAKALAEHVPLVIVTRGARGAVAIDAAHPSVVEVPSIPVDAVDPTGAGDVFSAAFMVGLLHDWDLETRLRFAVLSASVSVTGLGGATSAPHPAELRAFIERTRPPGDWAFLADLPMTTEGH